MDDRPFTTRQLAKRWQCSERMIRNHIASGDLAAFKYGQGYRIEAATVLEKETSFAPPARQARRGIYLIRCEVTGLVKVGSSADIDRRYEGLRTMCPTPLTLLNVIPGGREKEKRLHERFNTKRSHGEWFALSETDVQTIMAETL